MKKEKDQGKDIELKSDEVQELLGSVPSWILKNGILLLSAFIILLLIGSWFYKTPEIIKSSLVLTSNTPIANIIAKTNSNISELNVIDQQEVIKGECLAILDNKTSYNDIQYLEKELDSMLLTVNLEKKYNLKRRDLKIGKIEPVYMSLQIIIDKYNEFYFSNSYFRQIHSIKKLISANEILLKNFDKQRVLTLKQHEYIKNSYESDNRKKCIIKIPESQSDSTNASLLQSEKNIQEIEAKLENTYIRVLELNEAKINIEQKYLENRSLILSDTKTSIQKVLKEIDVWKTSYMLSSPIEGMIYFSNNWCINQNVTSGETIFTVIPKMPQKLYGKAIMSPERYGKVKVGQRVNVHFANFPINEYGMVIGTVFKTSLIPIDGKYTAFVKFPNDFLTTYGKRLPHLYGMTGNADIITDDLRLIDQFILPIKKILKNKL